MKKEKETKPKKLGSLLRTQIGVSIIITFFVTLVLSNFLLSGRTKQEIQNILATEVFQCVLKRRCTFNIPDMDIADYADF